MNYLVPRLAAVTLTYTDEEMKYQKPTENDAEKDCLFILYPLSYLYITYTCIFYTYTYHACILQMKCIKYIVHIYL